MSFLSDAVAIPPAHIIKLAQDAPSPRVAIARAGAPLPMLAAFEATQANMMVPLFTGERADIEAEADKLGWDISGFEIIDTVGEAEAGAAAGGAVRPGGRGSRARGGGATSGISGGRGAGRRGRRLCANAGVAS